MVYRMRVNIFCTIIVMCEYQISFVEISMLLQVNLKMHICQQK